MSENELIEPISRSDEYLASLCGMDVSKLPEPISRIDKLLATLCGMDVGKLSEPLSRAEQYLMHLVENGGTRLRIIQKYVEVRHDYYRHSDTRQPSIHPHLLGHGIYD